MTRTPAPATCSAVSTSTSSRSSPAPKGRRAASSTRRAASSRCWSRCWSRTGAGSTTRAAARRACSCSRWRSSGPTPSGNGNGGRARGDISIYGQESNYTTWRLAKMNLAIRGIEGQIAHGDSFHDDRHPDLKADFILANPPFNVSELGRRAADRGQALALRRGLRRATPISPGCSTWSTTWRREEWRASCSRTVRCRRASRARGRSGST